MVSAVDDGVRWLLLNLCRLGAKLSLAVAPATPEGPKVTRWDGPRGVADGDSSVPARAQDARDL